MSKATTGEFHSKDGRKLPIFIQSELDDYGLSPIEFRAYARIARRAGGDNKLTESVPNMAGVFGVAEVTVRRALQVLCLCGLISKKERPGWTPEYTLNEQDKWRDKAELTSVRGAVLHPKKRSETLITTDGGNPDHQTRERVITTDTTPSSPETDEGTPRKVVPESTPPLPPKKTYKPPVEIEVGPPPPYTGSEFLRQLRDFEVHRKKMKCPLNELSRVRIYNALGKVDEATATQALDDSIQNGWKGVFPERVKQNGANGHEKPDETRWMNIHG